MSVSKVKVAKVVATFVSCQFPKRRPTIDTNVSEAVTSRARPVSGAGSARPQPASVPTPPMGAALCRCFGPKLPPGSSRVVRMLSGGVRARALFIWVDEVAERKRLLNKLRVAAAAMANLPLKRGIQTWRELWEDICAAKAKLAEAARGIINAKSKRVFNTWLEAAAEERAKKDKLKRALALMSPEGRAKKLFVQRLVWVRRRKLAMQRAASGFILSGCRLALRSMHGQLMFRQRLVAEANNIMN